jgi:very-short-patch-repair endonuclease
LLALEELVYLLRVHCELPEPEFDTDATAIKLTPIERRLATALKTAGIPYRVQVPIDRLVVDFLIDDSLVVECDGEGWHDPATDEIRDYRLHELSYRVVRFTGRAIVHGSERCISRIKTER